MATRRSAREGNPQEGRRRKLFKVAGRVITVLGALGALAGIWAAYREQINETRKAEREARELLFAAQDALGLHDGTGDIAEDAKTAPYFYRQKLLEAKRKVEMAMELAPNYYEAYRVMGVIAALQGNSKEARKDFEKARKLNPRSSRVLNDLGNICRYENDNDSAVKFYRRAIALDASKAAYHTNLGSTLQSRAARENNAELLRQAIESLNRACSIDDRSTPAHFNLASALHDAGDYQGAVKHLLIVIELQPCWAMDRNAYDDLIMNYERLKDGKHAGEIRERKSKYEAICANRA